MAARPMVEGDCIGSEAQSDKIDEIRRIDTFLQKFIKEFIITLKKRKHLAAVRPGFLKFSVIMPIAAVVTAELLVSPPIFYLVTAFQTYRDRSFPFLIIIHTFYIYIIYAHKDGNAVRSAQEAERGFAFF